MRRIVTFDILGHRLIGTHHDPGAAGPGHAGVLLLSFGQQPRAWVGDLGAFAADRLCAAGYPTFRFDMPGLGDSPGDLPVHLEVLFRTIQEGAHRDVARALARELRRRYRLPSLVIGGFCGGAVTAALAVDPTGRETDGLIMLEPEVALQQVPACPTPVQEVDSVSAYLERLELIRERLRSPRSWLRLLTGRSDLRYWQGLARYAFKRFRERLTKQELPADLNVRMVNALSRAASRRLPTLILSVGIPSRRRYYSTYGFVPGRSDPEKGFTWIEIENTTHAMLTGGAKEAAPMHLVAWMQRYFPATAELRRAS
jgi:alpha-beta hydrolase superfamily lysophospholipase